MLTAILFVIRKVSQVLGVFLNIHVKLNDNGDTIRMYWIVLLPFILAMFLKLLYTILNQSVSTPWENYNSITGRYQRSVPTHIRSRR